MPLDPHHLTPDASLNRLTIVDLPGVAMEPGIKGKAGFDLLSARALEGYVRDRATALGLGNVESEDGKSLLRALERCLESADPSIWRAAEEISRIFGRRLGYLVLTLVRGDCVNRDARPDWDDSYWEHWAGIERIWIGGGLVSGSLGPLVVDQAMAAVHEAGHRNCSIVLAARPSELPLIGAARSVPDTSRSAAVFDFGQTWIKRAAARYDNGTLVDLKVLPLLPAEIASPDKMQEDMTGQAHHLASHMASVMAETWRQMCSPDPSHPPLFAASVAAYVRDGQLMPRQGGPHGTLHVVSANFAEWLSARVGGLLGEPVHLELIHDGTAAARTYAGAGRSTVIMLGTALGVGFPPGRESVTSMTPHILRAGDRHRLPAG